MKLFALIEDISSCDCGGEEGISVVWHDKAEVTYYYMDKIRRHFERFAEYNKDKPYDYIHAIGNPWKLPKICEIETGVDYSPFDFNNLVNVNDFINKAHPVFKAIEAHNLHVENNLPQIQKEKRMKELEVKKEQIQKLKEEIEELETSRP